MLRSTDGLENAGRSCGVETADGTWCGGETARAGRWVGVGEMLWDGLEQGRCYRDGDDADGKLYWRRSGTRSDDEARGGSCYWRRRRVWRAGSWFDAPGDADDIDGGKSMAAGLAPLFSLCSRRDEGRKEMK
ncbi:unnamed protein product [Linum trigynum]|uniref:Uncharacterized protein n=1 Tax=Linum trigynum TaxID=586398 RepID=A0AAV2EDD0_9ROSI